MHFNFYKFSGEKELKNFIVTADQFAVALTLILVLLPFLQDERDNLLDVTQTIGFYFSGFDFALEDHVLRYISGIEVSLSPNGPCNSYLK